MKHVDRTGLYLLVIICILNTCGVESEHEEILHEIKQLKEQTSSVIGPRAPTSSQDNPGLCAPPTSVLFVPTLLDDH